MTGRHQSRYPYLTRDSLGPAETIRDTVLIRDEHTCLGHGRACSLALSCTADLRVVTALPAGVAGGHENPVWLRTFCTAHADLDLRADLWSASWHANGWRIPDTIIPSEMLDYGRLVPVRAAGGWWTLDDWGDRLALTANDVDHHRSALRRRWGGA